jgi:hypothetical protein
MACNTIGDYLAKSWVGQRLHCDNKVAITYDKERENYEIAYLTNRTDAQGGRVRCAPFRDMAAIGEAFEEAQRDGALYVDHIAAVIESLR